MKTNVDRVKYITYKEILNLKKTHNLFNINQVNEKMDLYVVGCAKRLDDSKVKFSSTIDTETAVHIASAVTSMARIYMYKFKHIEDNECYYTDTDSVFLSKKLDDKYVGLGLFKLKYEFKVAMFIAPKVYTTLYPGRVKESGYLKVSNHPNLITLI